MATKDVEITSLTIYPLKSARGISVDRATVTAQGLEFDRQWMAVQANGKFATQRQISKMALLETALTDQGLQLSIGGQDSITLSYDLPQGERIVTEVWGDRVETIDEGESVSRWLTAALEVDEPVRLVRMAPEYQRPQSSPELLGKDTFVYFADAAPLLIADEASLTALNNRLESQGEQPVPMDRFRPNIVTRGLAAFEEHRVSSFTNDDCHFGSCFACERCVIVTTDQDTAARHPLAEPLRTLKALNTSPDKKPAFGQNCTWEKPVPGTVAVGDTLTAKLE